MLCDRVAILQRGRVRSQGRLQDLMSSAVQWIEISVRGPLPELRSAERLSVSGEESLLRVSELAALGPLLEAVQRAGGQVLSVWPKRDTLEDLFLRETGGKDGTEATEEG